MVKNTKCSKMVSTDFSSIWFEVSEKGKLWESTVANVFDKTSVISLVLFDAYVGSAWCKQNFKHELTALKFPACLQWAPSG